MTRLPLARRLVCRTLAVAALLIAAGAPAPAAAQPRRDWTPEEQADIARVETYLNAMTTLRARFLQFGENGSFGSGTFYLARPGRLRLEYDPPVPTLLIANYGLLVHYDLALKTVAHLPINSTPAGMLVQSQVQLSGELTVTGIEKAAGALRLSVVQTKDVRAGRITFVFTERPFALASWQVVDAQGQTIRVSLTEARADLPLEPELFHLATPGAMPETRN